MLECLSTLCCFQAPEGKSELSTNSSTTQRYKNDWIDTSRIKRCTGSKADEDMSAVQHDDEGEQGTGKYTNVESLLIIVFINVVFVLFLFILFKSTTI